MLDARLVSAQHLCELLEQMLAAATHSDWDAFGELAEQHDPLSQALRQAVLQAPQQAANQTDAVAPALRVLLQRASTLHDELLMLAEPRRDALGRELAQGRKQHALGRAYTA